MNCGLFQVIFW